MLFLFLKATYNWEFSAYVFVGRMIVVLLKKFYCFWLIIHICFALIVG